MRVTRTASVARAWIEPPGLAVVLAQVHALPDGGPPDDEVAEVRWLTLEELEREVASGTIEDGFTLAALTLARVHRLL